MVEFTKVAQASALAPGQAMCVEFAGEKVALFNAGGEIHAVSDTCTHVGGPISEGDVEGLVVTCPWHGARFELTTGKVLGPPARAALKRYAVRVEHGEIRIALE